MSAFDVIKLSGLPSPDIIETIDFETTLAKLKADLAARAPDLAPVLQLESEPLVKFLETLALESVYLRARVNDATRAVMLAHATGSNLDNLGVLMGVERLTDEVDDDFRSRIQLSLEGFTSCGTPGAYTYWALSADPDVKDVNVQNTAPGIVQITVLSRIGDGVPNAQLLTDVAAVLNDPDIRQLCDTVNVIAAVVLEYTISAVLHLADGPDPAVVVAAAQAAVDALVLNESKLGRRASRSGIFAALTVPGVIWVDLTSPAVGIAPTEIQVAHCTNISLTSEVA